MSSISGRDFKCPESASHVSSDIRRRLPACVHRDAEVVGEIRRGGMDATDVEDDNISWTEVCGPPPRRTMVKVCGELHLGLRAPLLTALVTAPLAAPSRLEVEVVRALHDDKRPCS